MNTGISHQRSLPLTPPAEWPQAPRWMSFSLLRLIEECPRKWALGAASYPDLWKGRGYPRRAPIATIAGTTVHLAVEKTCRALVEANCCNLQSPEAIEVMKTLGGHTALLAACLALALEPYRSNPRTVRVFDSVERDLRAELPAMRIQVQKLLARIGSRISGERPIKTVGGESVAHRTRLSDGIYPELEVSSEKIQWRGRIDLMVLRNSELHIVDFKTGVPRSHHSEQLACYALLWASDRRLNPEGKHATQLTLAYRSHDVTIPVPTEKDLIELEANLAARTTAAIEAATSDPPSAKPSKDACAYCEVRHLCTPYWTVKVQEQLAASGQPSDTFVDAEVLVLSQHGATSWDCQIQAAGHSLSGRKALVRSQVLGLELSVGARVRILNGHLSPAETAESPAIISLGSSSEVYETRSQAD